MKTHKMDTHLFVNAGIRFPLCYARAELLDTDKSRLLIANEVKMEKVDCLRCLAIQRRQNETS